MLRKAVLILYCIFATSKLVSQNEVSVSGVITTSDSSEVVPFVYVFCKNTGHGVMSNLNGIFHLTAKENDTIIFHHTQYFPLKIPVKELKQPQQDLSRVQMKRKFIQLPEVKVMDYSLKPYEKERMDKIIRESKINLYQSLNSPITAMYYTWSRRGRELRKLARIYEELLLEEKIREKLSPDALRKLTGDDQIDYENFRKFCFELRTEDYLFLDGYQLYQKVMDCYRRYKREK
ncbi:MAG: carboxypeptidase-like regulatory domain-containing protein [Bacteroidia bacterium]|nr:carboxypeptidase-like regulatory domain-containing protein [Bacteroidia bacterium]